MRKHLLLLSLAALAVLPAAARSLSPDEALNRALHNGRKAAARSIGARGSVISEPVMTIESEGNPALYVFNRTGEGFVIVSASDVAAPILGYSDSGVFDPADIPDNFKGWLDNCAGQIRRAAAAGVEPYVDAREVDFTPIEPLIKTKWNQNVPFNNDCPTSGGTRCPTGCVATAMAQVMKYYEWPEQAAENANFEYSWKGSTLTANFSNYEFDWSNMLSSYTNGYDDAQAEAVAKLMQACGYSVNMIYDSAASAAVNNLAGYGLAQYFKYDQGLHNEPREAYTLQEWEKMLHDNLSIGSPLIYWGGIHCFICDGYQSNGYFHFNWGWGGDGDGWFLIDALNPSNVGIGGSGAGYNADQGALFGIKPAGETESPRQYTFYSSGLESTHFSGTYLYLDAIFTNYSPFPATAQFRFSIYSEDGTTHITSLPVNPTYGGGSGSTMDFAPDTRQFQINGPIPTSYSNDGTLGDGTIYRVYPAIYADGKEYIFEGPQSMPNYVLWSRTKNGANWVYTAELPDVGHKEILDLSTNGDLYQGQPRIKISGIAKFTGNAKSSMNFTWRILSATDNSTVAVGESLNLLFTPEGNHFLTSSLFEGEKIPLLNIS